MSTATHVRRIRGTARLRKKPGADAVELAVDNTGKLKFWSPDTAAQVEALDTSHDFTAAGALTLSGAITASGTVTFSGATAGLRAAAVETQTGDDTLTTAESGSIYLCTKSSATQTFTLPATVLGVTYTFIAGHADGEINISPNSADKITGKGIAGNDDGDIKNTAASNAVGDAITIVGDGADGWLVVSMLGTWAVV